MGLPSFWINVESAPMLAGTRKCKRRAEAVALCAMLAGWHKRHFMQFGEGCRLTQAQKWVKKKGRKVR
jgi:hypothetical protein